LHLTRISQTRDILESLTEVIRFPHIMQIPKVNLQIKNNPFCTFLKSTGRTEMRSFLMQRLFADPAAFHLFLFHRIKSIRTLIIVTIKFMKSLDCSPS